MTVGSWWVGCVTLGTVGYKSMFTVPNATQYTASVASQQLTCHCMY